MKKKSGSIKYHLLFPLLVIMLIQAVLFTAIILYGGVSRKLKNNAVAILDENTENSRLYLEKEIVHRWINIVKNTDTLAVEIQEILAEEGRDISDIKTDAGLNKTIVDGVTEKLIDLLHRSYATGVFVVLDGPAAEKSGDGVKAGLYVRDLDTSSYAHDFSDLLLERGLPSISTKYGITLDSFWELGFSVDQKDAGTEYYHKPFDAAVYHKAKAEDASNYAFLSMPFSLSPSDTQVITYSLPLIMSDGSVIGVMGMDMTLSQIETLMDEDDLSNNGYGICLLGVRQKDTNTILRAVSTGSSYDGYFGGADRITYENGSEEAIKRVISEDGTKWYASVRPLEIYSTNTPFEDEEWVMVGMVRETDLLSFYITIRNMMMAAFIITLAFSVVGVFVIGKIVTDPIRSLADELKLKSGSRHLSLRRVRINEIDELTETIEKLSADVERSASKISTILENANVMIGVFECNEDDKSVFCSRSLFEMLEWGSAEEPYVYVPKPIFTQRMKLLEVAEQDGAGNIFCICGANTRWVKLLMDQKEEKIVIGVFTDVTGQILEKQKLERERDYDLLTDIYNRRAFRKQVTDLLVRKVYESGAVIMWDLDNLKYINDTYGHDEGDRYIRLFARQLKGLETDGGIVCRYSGDEFVTFLDDPKGKEGIRSRLKSFMASLKETKLLLKEEYGVPLRVSAGVAWYPEDADDFDTLFNYADFAMYTVKHSVKGNIMEFDKSSYTNNSYMLAGREELNQLFEMQDVNFAFQPIVDRSGLIYGYELLMRPQLKNLKGINEVLNLSREQSKLPQMEELTWRAGFKAIDRHVRKGNIGDQEYFFMNSIASVSLTRAQIKNLENDYGAYLSRVVMELTESEPMDRNCLDVKLSAIRRWNGMVAIDDFGSGYNGENALLELTPDIVKIDMNLIQNIDQDPNRQAIVKHLISYAKNNGVKVLAEGVERAEELKLLMEYGIDYFQGYYIARPELEIRPITPYVIEKMQSFLNESDL